MVIIISFCADYDILFFTETKTENFDLTDSLLKDYTVFTKTNDNHDFLFAVHGICIPIKTEIAHLFDLCHDTVSKHFVWLKTVWCFTVWLWTFTWCFVHSLSIFEDIMDDISMFDFPVCMIDDLNARTGVLQDIDD